MPQDAPARRSFLGGAVLAGLGVLTACGSRTTGARPTSSSSTTAGPSAPARDVTPALTALETTSGRRIGIVALDTGFGRRVRHRADERFLLCSTGKVATVATVLHLADRDASVLDRTVHYDASRLVTYSPVTSQHLTDGLTVRDLCAAALTVSDNTAENLLADHVGGPAAVTAFLRSLGDPVTRLDRAEPELNDRSGDLDTTTPAAAAADLQRLLLGDGLAASSRAALTDWMRACTTGLEQIRSGVPAGWPVADKTGSGSHAENNDVAVAWPPGRAPLVVAVYTDTPDGTSANGPQTIAAATRIAVAALT